MINCNSALRRERRHETIRRPGSNCCEDGVWVRGYDLSHPRVSGEAFITPSRTPPASRRPLSPYPRRTSRKPVPPTEFAPDHRPGTDSDDRGDRRTAYAFTAGDVLDGDSDKVKKQQAPATPAETTDATIAREHLPGTDPFGLLGQVRGGIRSPPTSSDRSSRPSVRRRSRSNWGRPQRSPEVRLSRLPLPVNATTAARAITSTRRWPPDAHRTGGDQTEQPRRSDHQHGLEDQHRHRDEARRVLVLRHAHQRHERLTRQRVVQLPPPRSPDTRTSTSRTTNRSLGWQSRKPIGRTDRSARCGPRTAPPPALPVPGRPQQRIHSQIPTGPAVPRSSSYVANPDGHRDEGRRDRKDPEGTERPLSVPVDSRNQALAVGVIQRVVRHVLRPRLHWSGPLGVVDGQPKP